LEVTAVEREREIPANHFAAIAGLHGDGGGWRQQGQPLPPASFSFLVYFLLQF